MGSQTWLSDFHWPASVRFLLRSCPLGSHLKREEKTMKRAWGTQSSGDWEWALCCSRRAECSTFSCQKRKLLVLITIFKEQGKLFFFKGHTSHLVSFSTKDQRSGKNQQTHKRALLESDMSDEATAGNLSVPTEPPSAFIHLEANGQRRWRPGCLPYILILVLPVYHGGTLCFVNRLSVPWTGADLRCCRWLTCQKCLLQGSPCNLLVMSEFMLDHNYFSVKDAVHRFSLLSMCLFSCVQCFVTLWTVTCQALLFMEFSRQEYWSGLPFPIPFSLLADVKKTKNKKQKTKHPSRTCTQFYNQNVKIVGMEVRLGALLATSLKLHSVPVSCVE